MNIVAGERNQRIVSACFLIVIGVLMCCFTNFSAGVFAMVAGIVSIVFGCLYIFAYFVTLLVHDPYMLMRGFFLLILGACILSDPGTFLYVTIFAASLFLMYMGIEELAFAIDLDKLGVKNWWVDLIYSLISLACGIAILVVEYTGGNSLGLVISMAGAFLIFEGAFELVLILAMHRDYRKFNKRIYDE
jgi:uncharacterized membrane protein HdeD (DUF308 family)